ncbi:hypothetical protein GLOIN_2v1790588 [Rhizophagus irregularis DAOM 181602=DAOM 197198]|nr:hypothetical protein GLOIN_2v1790588 [Rhizophagus irregularis DAOM 181602=DAOM 197198]
MVVNRDVQNANHRLKHALNLLIHRCRETYEERDILKAERNRSRKERDELQDELEVQTGLLGLTQDELNNVQDTITSLEANLAELEREFGGMRTTNRRFQQQYNLMRGERNRAIGERNRAIGERDESTFPTNSRSAYPSTMVSDQTIEPSSTSFQPSTKYDMAAVGIAAPIFHGREDEDLNLFIDNFLGYINTVGIDPLDDAGAPPGRVRAMGVLRSCMRDEAARWFDAELTGKNWELSNIRLVATANGGAGATRRAFRALAVPEVANGLHVGTYLPGSDVDAYSRILANAARTVGETFFPSRADIVRTNFKVEEQWRHAGGRPTNQPVNGLGNHGGPFNAAVQNQPIVLQEILLDQAFMHMRTNFPTVVEERLQIQFSNLYQEQGEPVRSYYKRVERAGDIVGYNRIMVTDQFYRGLLPENVIEASRIGAAPLNTLIDRLSDLERRKGEMFYGLQRRQGIEKAKKEELAGYTHPVTPHEGAVIQRSTDVITQERLQELLKAQAEELTKNFQAQFKQLQASKPVRKPPVYRQQIKPVRPKPRPRVVQDHQDPDWDDGYVDHDFGDDPGDPDAPEWTSEDDQHVIDLIMGYETSKRFPKRLQKAKDRRDDLELARAMRNLDLNDDAMDIDTNTASFDDLKIVPDEEGGFRIFKMTPIKIPVKVTSSKPTLIKAVTKNDSLSLLRSADFRKLLREILREELKSARKSTEIPEDLVEEKQEEDIREDDPMDIDIARLENTKDLLALDGKVNGIAIQCLADTCANASFIQREAAEELGLDIDKSITHNISGTPGSGRTFGMVKGVSIKLTPDCVITENLAVLSNYKHREIGLSRTCLKRYNYDVHESREHIALTCNEKNVFIPIVSDVNRGDKK